MFQADAAEELRAYQILCLLTISVLFFSKNTDLPLLAKLNLFPAPIAEPIHGQPLPKRIEDANENYIGLTQLPVMHAFQQHVRADQALVIARPQRKFCLSFPARGNTLRKIIVAQFDDASKGKKCEIRNA